MLSQQAALVYTMVIAAEADHEIADAEAGVIGQAADRLPLFNGLAPAAMARLAAECSELVAEHGPEAALALVREALPPRVRNTAYALACTVVSADRRLHRQEFDVLELIRAELEIEPELAARIEGAAEEHVEAA